MNNEKIMKKLEELKLIAQIRQKEGAALEKLVEGMEALHTINPDFMPAKLMQTYFNHKSEHDAMWIDLDLREKLCWSEIIEEFKSK